MAELGKMLYFDLADLEARFGRVKMRWFVRESEADFARAANDLAAQAAWQSNVQAIFISGPTSSGKTTFTKRIEAALHALGRPTVTINMDDYYKEVRTRTDAEGRPDFESLDTLDISLLVEHVKQLLAGHMVQIPEYRFVERKRIFPPEKNCILHPRSILLVEGLHGLCSEIAEQIDPKRCLKVFIMPYAGLYSDRKLLGPREIRILRRIARDVNHRGANPLSTLDYWPMIEKIEDEVVSHYLKRADVYVNSAMPYEFLVIAPMAGRLITRELEDYRCGIIRPSIYVNKQGLYADLRRSMLLAQQLIQAVEDIPQVAPGVVPEISILNEFMR